MKALSRITDCALGHLGLFLIGAISWTADRLSTSGSGSEIWLTQGLLTLPSDSSSDAL